LRAVQILITAVPSLLLVLGLLFTWRYPIDKKGYTLIQKRLEQPTGDSLSPGEQKELQDLIKRAY
jgi:Na+/melibiose symporter-like transporter